MNPAFFIMMSFMACSAPPAEAIDPHAAAPDSPHAMSRLLVEVIHGEDSRDSSTMHRVFSLENGQVQFTKRPHPPRNGPPFTVTFPANDDDILQIQNILAALDLQTVPPYVDPTRQSPGTYLSISVEYAGRDATWSWASEGPTGWGRESPPPFKQTAAYSSAQDLVARLEALARNHAPQP